MPIGTCMQLLLLVKPVRITGTHCSAKRHLYAEANETVCNGAAMPFGIVKCRAALPCSLRKNMCVPFVKQLIFIYFQDHLLSFFNNKKQMYSTKCLSRYGYSEISKAMYKFSKIKFSLLTKLNTKLIIQNTTIYMR